LPIHGDSSWKRCKRFRHSEPVGDRERLELHQ
jgi:hypothetical protein